MLTLNLRPVQTGILLAAAALLLPGCGASTEQPDFVSELVPVTGTVTLEGAPLEGVMVNFMPQEGNAIAYGLTDASGKYSLQPQMSGQAEKESTGALPGEYQVYISKLVLPDGTAVPEGLSDAEAEEKGAKQLLPPKYSSPANSSLKATVEKGQTTVDFELKK